MVCPRSIPRVLSLRDRRNRAIVRTMPRRGLVSIGVTLVKVVFVVGVVGLVALVVLVAVMPGRGRPPIKTAQSGAQSIRSAITMFIAENPGECPSTHDLRDGYLAASKSLEDPWGGKYLIACSGMTVDVSSAGPDRRFGTRDDIGP